jgi:hypothetical protein
VTLADLVDCAIFDAGLNFGVIFEACLLALKVLTKKGAETRSTKHEAHEESCTSSFRRVVLT